MTRIESVVCSIGRTGFFADDQAAVKSGLKRDGFFCLGEPRTPGFRAVRQPGESVSVMLLLSDGRLAWGDCASVQYSGAGGRDPAFCGEEAVRAIQQSVAPMLCGKTVGRFREMAAEAEALQADGRPLHTAIRYGVSQAILDAVSVARGVLPCEVVAEEYGAPPPARPVPIFAQSGDERWTNADKMIAKGVDVLPHGLFNNIPEKLGERGEKLHEYVEWLRDRVLRHRPAPDYSPVFHIDVYGLLGQVFDNDTARIGGYLAGLGEGAAPFRLRIEGCMDAGSRQGQCDALRELREHLRDRGIAVELVADEWCNTLEDTRLFADAGAADMIQIKTPDLGGIQNSAEAVLYCKERGVGAYLGGSCNETDRSAQVCVHLALALRPDQMLAKPGMGVDEGFMIVYNEMRRALALLAERQESRT